MIGDKVPGWVLFGAGGVVVVSMVFMFWARRLQGRALSGKGRLDQGRLVGVVGLPGYGKTSFIVSNYVLPMLREGRTVLANFTVYADEFEGRFIKMKSGNYGADLIGIGSSLNLDDDLEAMSGWFVDTACNCSKTCTPGCLGRIGPQACCKGMRAKIMCGCNGAVLVIDEAHAFLPASQSKPLPVDLLTWLTMCRKNHLMIVWATQYVKWVHSAVRRLTEDVFMCESQLLAGHHVARLHHLGFTGELGREVSAEVKYKIGEVGEFYDTSEVIVAASTAYEMAGEMSRKNIANKVGSGATQSHAAPGRLP